MHRATARLCFVLLGGFLLGGCTSVTTSPRSATATTAGTSVLDRLYFGRSIPRGGSVSDQDWATFLAEVVTPRFPAGLTVWHADGQWRDASGRIWREPSHVLELIHADGAAAEKAIAEIIAEYRKRFAQDSVMRVHERVEVSF